MTPDNPFMPQSIRDAIVPGAAADYFFDPENPGAPAAPDGVLLTRDNYDLGINAVSRPRAPDERAPSNGAAWEICRADHSLPAAAISM